MRRVILFCLIVVTLFVLIRNILTPKFFDQGWNHRLILQGFYAEEENTIDVLFLGSSMFMSGISPMRLYDQFGVYSYSLATSQQNFITSYYTYLEACKSQDPDVVVIEVQMLFDDNQDKYYHFGIDYLKPSINKIKLVHALYDNKAGIEDQISFLSRMYSYHSRWEDLSRDDFIRTKYDSSYCTKGFAIMLNTKKNYEYYGLSYENDKTGMEYCEKYKMDYLEKLISKAQADDRKVILVKTPRCDWNTKRHNVVQKIADSYGIEFLDYNECQLFKITGFDSKTDYMDQNHLNYFGAIKLTDSLGKYLIDKNEFGNHTEEERKKWERDYINYKKQVERLLIKKIDNLDDYFRKLLEIEDECTICIAVRDDASSNMQDKTMTLMHDMGLKGSLRDQYQCGYIAIIEKGKIIEELGPEKNYLSTSGILDSGCRYNIESAGYEDGNNGLIFLDDVQYAINYRGINIVVYDNTYGAVIDSVCFDTYTDNQSAIR